MSKPTQIGVAMQEAAAKLTVTPDKPPGPTPDYLRMALNRSGIPQRYVDHQLATFRAVAGTEKALAAARACVDEPRGMVLIGKPGSGKTHLAVGILRAIAEAGSERDTSLSFFRSRFVVVPDLLDTLRERINDSTVRDPLPTLATAPLLVLDDLGREKPSEWVTDRLYVLVNRRYNNLLPTIVTTNYQLSELADRGYDAMMSRLRDGASVVTLTAGDYRKAA